jgi:hypothetical protein
MKYVIDSEDFVMKTRFWGLNMLETPLAASAVLALPMFVLGIFLPLERITPVAEIFEMIVCFGVVGLLFVSRGYVNIGAMALIVVSSMFLVIAALHEGGNVTVIVHDPHMSFHAISRGALLVALVFHVVRSSSLDWEDKPMLARACSVNFIAWAFALNYIADQA